MHTAPNADRTPLDSLIYVKAYAHLAGDCVVDEILAMNIPNKLSQELDAAYEYVSPLVDEIIDDIQGLVKDTFADLERQAARECERHGIVDHPSYSTGIPVQSMGREIVKDARGNDREAISTLLNLPDRYQTSSVRFDDAKAGK